MLESGVMPPGCAACAAACAWPCRPYGPGLGSPSAVVSPLRRFQ